MLSIIAAMDKNRLIGRKNQLPWHLPADLKHFKALTLGKPIIMGRKTYESIGKPLPGRRNMVVSQQNNKIMAGCEIFDSLTAAIAATHGESEIIVIGGATLFAQALPLADKMYLTLIEHVFTGDVFFPSWPPQEWQEIARETYEDSTQAFTYHFVQLIRRPKCVFRKAL